MDEARNPEAGPAQPRPWWKKKRYVIPLGVILLAIFGSAEDSEAPEDSIASGARAPVATVPQGPAETTAPPEAPTQTTAPEEPPAETVAPQPTTENARSVPEVMDEGPPPTEEPEQPAPTPDAEDGALTVSAANIDPWPLTVEQGVLRCEGNAVTFTLGGGPVYAVNGLAETWGAGVDLEPIWREDPEIPGLRVNVGPLIDAGLDLC